LNTFATWGVAFAVSFGIFACPPVFFITQWQDYLQQCSFKCPEFPKLLELTKIWITGIIQEYLKMDLAPQMTPATPIETHAL